MQSRVGSLIRGKYKVDEFISKGSMAAVYAASHRNGTKVALKILHAAYSKDESLRTRFLREGYLANSVEHPGTVKVLDDDVTEDGSAFLVMELLKGDTFEHLRVKAGGKLSVHQVLVFADQLLGVIEAAHAKGIVHRDLKPENIFVTKEGTVKVLDWGVANVWDGQKSSEMTGTGMVLGTPAFMPPEQALGKRSEVDAQSDIWAVGATLFALLAGESVHPGGDAVTKLVATARKPARSLGMVAPEVPNPVVAAVDRALAFRKVDRWPTASAFRSALLNTARRTDPPPRPSAKKRRQLDDDEPTLYNRSQVEDLANSMDELPDYDPSTEPKLPAAVAFDDSPLSVDDRTQQVRSPLSTDDRTQQARSPVRGRLDSAPPPTVPPPTEIPVTRAPHTSPMPLSGDDRAAARKAMAATAPLGKYPVTQALPTSSLPQSLPRQSKPLVTSTPKASFATTLQPPSTPLSTAMPAPGARLTPDPQMLAIAPTDMPSQPLPIDTLSPPPKSGGGGRAVMLILLSFIIIGGGAGAVVKRRTIYAMAQNTMAQGVATVAAQAQQPAPGASSTPILGPATMASAMASVDAGATTNAGDAGVASGGDAGLNAIAAGKDLDASAALAMADAPAPSPAPVKTASPRPRPRPPPAAQPTATATDDSTDTPAPTPTPVTTATSATTADKPKEKTPDPAPTIPQKVAPEPLPPDPE
jgi:serine/threonine-protein kinase